MTARVDIRAEIAGSVWQLVAQPGEMLAPDDTVLLLESMKMEIPVLTPRAGRLLEFRVAAGDMVAEGDVVAILAV